MMLFAFLFAAVPMQEGGLPLELPQEIITLTIPPEVAYQKMCPYASLSFNMGPGISVRKREGNRGTAFDSSVCVGPNFSTHSSHGISVTLSGDYNWFFFATAHSVSSFYGTIGAGGGLYADTHSSQVGPYLYAPLRFGWQFTHGFIDLGAKMLWVMIPIPELRAGFGFDY